MSNEGNPGIETSTEIAELAKALSLAQAEMTAATKDKKNPHFNSSYADLASVWEACRGPLTKNGLAVVQLPLTDGERVGVSTTLLHSSGQWIRGALWGRPEKPGPQALVSCVTYFRRTALSAVAGIAPDDDDGNAAQGKGETYVAGRGAEKKAGAATAARPVAAATTTTPTSTAPATTKAPPTGDANTKTIGQRAPASKFPHDGTRATPEQVKLIHILREKVGGLSEDLYRRQLAAFKNQAGQPITTSKHLCVSQADHLIARYREKIKGQEATAAKGIPLDDVPEREPGDDDESPLAGEVAAMEANHRATMADTGEAADAGDIADLEEACFAHWGSGFDKKFKLWLKERFQIDTVLALTQAQVKAGIQELRS